MPKVGKQTWIFPSEPRVIGTGTVAGKVESEGPLGSCFDVRHGDDRLQHDTWEHAEQALFDEAVAVALEKSRLQSGDLDLLIGGDLNAQLSGLYFGLRSHSVPTLGVYSACATMCQAVSLAGMAIDAGFAKHVLVGTSSHVSTAERQFRYPTEYGAQKPPTAQRTVTGSGVAVFAASGGVVALTAATIGKVTDLGIQSPWEMGAAMAPAASATIRAHLYDTGASVEDFDCIATGDLGHIGHEILQDLLMNQGIDPGTRLTDCGMLIYRKDQPEVFSGGSGGACSSLVTFGHLVKQLESGDLKKVLVCATGALLSAVTAQQGDTIPAIAHAIVLERKG